MQRFALGGPLKHQTESQLIATERDVDNIMSFLRAIEQAGVYHVQFNIISSEALKKAMQEPDKYRDLMVRVASFTLFRGPYPEQQLDIIRRTNIKAYSMISIDSKIKTESYKAAIAVTAGWC